MPQFIDSIVSFLRAGYPDGVPEYDYIPLFALLSRQLTPDEVDTVAETLAADGDPASATAIRRAIEELTRCEPLPSDVSRVAAHLAAGGWPLAPVHQREPSA